MLNKFKHLKMIRITKQPKNKGLYRFFDGEEYREFTNERKYIKEVNAFQREMNFICVNVVNDLVRKLIKLEKPIDELEEISMDCERLRSAYYFSKRGGINDSYRVAVILKDLKRKYM